MLRPAVIGLHRCHGQCRGRGAAANPPTHPAASPGRRQGACMHRPSCPMCTRTGLAGPCLRGTRMAPCSQEQCPTTELGAVDPAPARLGRSPVVWLRLATALAEPNPALVRMRRIGPTPRSGHGVYALSPGAFPQAAMARLRVLCLAARVCVGMGGAPARGGPGAARIPRCLHACHTAMMMTALWGVPDAVLRVCVCGGGGCAPTGPCTAGSELGARGSGYSYCACERMRFCRQDGGWQSCQG